MSRMRIAAFALAWVCAAPAVAAAQDSSVEKGVLGVGIILGEPTGVSAKLYLSDDTAIDAALGSALVGGGIQIHADYLWHPWILENRDSFVLPAYVGVGGRLLNHTAGDGGDDDVHAGVRAVGGMLFDFKSVPLDVFVELAAVLDYVIGSDDADHGGVGLDVNAGAGVRYYF